MSVLCQLIMHVCIDYIQEKLLRNDISGHFQYVCFPRVAKW